MTTKTETKTEIAQQYDTLTLRKMLQEEQGRKLQICQAEFNAVLEKHNAMLAAVPFIDSNGRIGANAVLQPKP